MNKPYIDSISTKSDSKYLLIVAAAKRARQITTNEPELTRSGKINPVSQALHEINDDELTWEIGDSDAPPADLPAVSRQDAPAADDGGTEDIAEDNVSDNIISDNTVAEE